jgi:hypothetical protein
MRSMRDHLCLLTCHILISRVRSLAASHIVDTLIQPGAQAPRVIAHHYLESGHGVRPKYPLIVVNHNRPKIILCASGSLIINIARLEAPLADAPFSENPDSLDRWAMWTAGCCPALVVLGVTV